MILKQEQQLIKEALEKAIKNKEIAGANILILENGKELFYAEDGFSNIKNNKPIKRDTIFRLYSMTKPITGACIMILLERGELDLFDPVFNYIPSFKNQKVVKDGQLETPTRNLTIKDLLNMTSGLLYPGTCKAGASIDTVFNSLDKRFFSSNEMTTLEFADKIGQAFLAFNPGEEWAYGTSADILGAIVEVISGKSLGQFMNDELFVPLGMNDTAFYVPTDKQDRLATVYNTTEKNELEIYNGNNLGISNIMDKPPSFESGGAGLASTIDDYSKFSSMLINRGTFNGKTILKTKSVEFFTTQILNHKQSKNLNSWFELSGFSYGNLMRIMTKPELAGGLSCLGEYGWDGWLGCYVANLPNEKVTILVMMQKKDAGTISLTRKLRNIIIGSI